MGKRGRHVAPRTRARIWIPITGALATLAIAGGILISSPALFATAGPNAALSTAPTVAAFDKNWADGPAKASESPTVAQTPTIEPASPAPGSGFVSPLCPDGSVRGEVDSAGVANTCAAPAAGHPGG